MRAQPLGEEGIEGHGQPSMGSTAIHTTDATGPATTIDAISISRP